MLLDKNEAVSRKLLARLEQSSRTHEGRTIDRQGRARRRIESLRWNSAQSTRLTAAREVTVKTPHGNAQEHVSKLRRVMMVRFLDRRGDAARVAR